MADPGRSETLTDERADDAGTDADADTAIGKAEATESTDETTAEETTGEREPASEPEAATGTDDTLDTDDDDFLDEDDEDDAPARPWALIAATTVAVLAVVALAVTAFLAPGWAIRPGSPDGVATQATSALAAKDPAQLDAVSCRDQQGAPTNPFPPEALSLVQQATPAGPPILELDTQARAPVDLVLSAQGQVQQLPADIVLGVTDGRWCMTGISQRG
ncbi:hypothetical protein ACFPK1_11365 [Actinomycetospora rhizophila]|uniref:Uncharacterized protein n=1 Tax=Actinomycetospora rhizophila TaxID=1416876 RepID=A0ABV9ZB61_9PSEU